LTCSSRGLACLAAVATLLVTPAEGAAPSVRVKYRSATTVYLEAGRAEGLATGDRLGVQSGETTVAELEVIYVAEHSASCRVLSESRTVRAGDVAVVLRRAPREAAPGPTAPQAQPTPKPAAAPAPAPASADKPEPPWARLRGGASIGYYQAWDNSASDLGFRQTTGRLDLTLSEIRGQPLTFTVRLRGRRDVRSRAVSFRTPETEGADRLYEMALRYEPPSDRCSLEVGRVGVSRFVGIGYLDGLIGRFRAARSVVGGAFFGKRAEPEGFGFEGSGSKYGAFVQIAPARRWASSYEVQLAAVRELEANEVSREYVSLEVRLRSRRAWLFQHAELDVNRGWRQELTGKSTQLSNVSVSGNLRLSASSTAFLSYDGLRNYRYYQNRDVPEAIFDDLLRQGLRAGLNVSGRSGLGLAANVGVRLREADPARPELEKANAYSAALGVRHSRLRGGSLSLAGDAAGFRNEYTEGGILTARAGTVVGKRHALDLGYGLSLQRVSAGSSGLPPPPGSVPVDETRTNQWIRLTCRSEIRKRLQLLADLDYSVGDDLKGPRAFLELAYRF
jgi:hypothetical protein